MTARHRNGNNHDRRWNMEVASDGHAEARLQSDRERLDECTLRNTYKGASRISTPHAVDDPLFGELIRGHCLRRRES